MRGRIPDKIRVEHILECIDEIDINISGLTYADFINNKMVVRATERCLEIIGEAANHITEETKDNYPDIDWYNIIGLRNVLAHEYFGINTNNIWRIATVLLKVLQPKVEQMFYELD